MERRRKDPVNENAYSGWTKQKVQIFGNSLARHIWEEKSHSILAAKNWNTYFHSYLKKGGGASVYLSTWLFMINPSGLCHSLSSLDDDSSVEIITFKMFHRDSPQCLLFQGRNDLCVYVDIQVKFESEALLGGVLQGATFPNTTG